MLMLEIELSEGNDSNQHDFSPPSSGFTILQFARKIERLLDNDQLELIR